MKKHTSTKAKQSKLGKFVVNFWNQPEYHDLKREIFGQDTYFFESSSPFPKILDVGAHIGLSALYFKKLYPGAEITCFEPIHSSFELLQQNIFENNLRDVSCWQLAISPSSGPLTLHIDPENTSWYSSASIRTGAWNGQQATRKIEVKAATLDQITTQPIELLKLDVEGAEQAILESSQKVLPLIKQLLIEFHPGGNQSLEKISTLLEKNGYSLDFRKNGQSVSRQNAKGLFIIHATRMPLN